MENFEISQEMEQMREQFRILTEKVERQNIVSENQLKRSVHRKLNLYDTWETWIQLIILLIYIPVAIKLTDMFNMPQWVNVMTVTFCLAAIGFIIIKKRKLNRSLDYKGDVREFAENTKKLKKWHIKGNLISLPFTLIYIIIYFVEYFKVNRYDFELNAVILFTISIVAVVIIACAIDSMKRRTLDDIINEIEG